MKKWTSNLIIFVVVLPFLSAALIGFEFWPITNYPMYSSIGSAEKYIHRFDLYLLERMKSGDLREFRMKKVKKLLGLNYFSIDINLGLFNNLYKLPDWEHYRTFPLQFYDLKAKAYFDLYKKRNPSKKDIIGLRIYVTRYQIKSIKRQDPLKLNLKGEYILESKN